MGKATGGSHISSGQYNITREMDESVFEAILEKVKLRRDALNDVLIPEKQAEYDSLESESANRNLDLSNAIISLRLVMQGVKEPYSDSEKAQISEAESAVRTATNKAQEAKVEAEKALLKLESDKAEYASVLLEVEKYQSLINQVTDEETMAWSADLADGDGANGGTAEHAWNGSNSVGTIELNNDGNSLPILRPAYFAASAPYNKDRDGVLKPAYYFPFGGKAPTPTAAAAYWNQAMRPGFQKWRPNYKSGRIVSINRPADTCTVRLDPLDIDGVSLNQEETIQNVPIEYMYCNNQAFSTGDHVVVEFGNSLFENPKVIGYVDNPKPCGSVKLNLAKSGDSQLSEGVTGWQTGDGGTYRDYKGKYCPSNPAHSQATLDKPAGWNGWLYTSSYTITYSQETKEHKFTYSGKDYPYHYEGTYTNNTVQDTPTGTHHPATEGCLWDDYGGPYDSGFKCFGKATADIYFVMGEARIPVLTGYSTMKKELISSNGVLHYHYEVYFNKAEIEWVCSDGRYYSYLEKKFTLIVDYNTNDVDLQNYTPTWIIEVTRKGVDENGVINEALPNQDQNARPYSWATIPTSWDLLTAFDTERYEEAPQHGTKIWNWEYTDGHPTEWLNQASLSFSSSFPSRNRSKYSISSVDICPP